MEKGRKSKAQLNSPVKPKVERTEYAQSRPTRESKKTEIMNYDKLGGLAEGTEEHLGYMTDATMITDFTDDLIKNQCSVYFAGFGINHEVDNKMAEGASACFCKIDKMLPHQFAEIFKAGGKKNPDILSYEEVQNDHEKLKKWLVDSALKEIQQLEDKGAWTKCLKSEANRQQIIPCTLVF